MIQIKQIDFYNYRIAGTSSLSFDDPDNGYYMYGLIAENGTGKTTILNAITWCLYGEEYQLKDADRALPIINAKKLKEMELYETADVSVRLTIIDKDTEMVFERTHRFIRMETDDGVPIATPDNKSDFVVTTSDLSNPNSTVSHYNDDANYYVAEYFEKSIHDFFFFDGEKLEEFFTKNKANSIQTSVEAIAQISLLDTVIKNSRVISNTKSRNVGKRYPNVKRLEKERDDACKTWKKDGEELKRLNEMYADREQAKKEVDKLLNDNSTSKELQAQKELLKENLIV